MKKLFLGILLLPVISLAAPSGQNVCRDAAKTVEFSYGAYANYGDGGTLKINGQSFAVSVNAGEGEGSLNELIIPFCPSCDPTPGAQIGTAKWEAFEGYPSDAKAIKLSFAKADQKVSDLVLKCKIVDFKPGTEQN